MNYLISNFILIHKQNKPKCYIYKLIFEIVSQILYVVKIRSNLKNLKNIETDMLLKKQKENGNIYNYEVDTWAVTTSCVSFCSFIRLLLEEKNKTTNSIIQHSSSFLYLNQRFHLKFASVFIYYLLQVFLIHP